MDCAIHRTDRAPETLSPARPPCRADRSAQAPPALTRKITVSRETFRQLIRCTPKPLDPQLAFDRIIFSTIRCISLTTICGESQWQPLSITTCRAIQFHQPSSSFNLQIRRTWGIDSETMDLFPRESISTEECTRRSPHVPRETGDRSTGL